jgi:adenosylcobinamide-GDP ribazoletransferase
MLNFFSALTFLTIIRIPRLGNWEDGQKVLYFPLVGILIGLGLWGVDTIGSLLFNLELRCAFDLIFLAIISGGLHLDGLADSADGILAHRGREKALEIMRDSRIGVMGTLVVFFCLLLKFTSLQGLPETTRWIWLIAAPALARTSMAIGLIFTDYARNEGGLGTVFFQKNRYSLLSLSPLALLIPLLISPVSGLIALAGFFITLALLFSFFNRTIGGMTGDTLGATAEIVEAVIMVEGVVLSHWISL